MLQSINFCKSLVSCDILTPLSNCINIKLTLVFMFIWKSILILQNSYIHKIEFKKKLALHSSKKLNKDTQ